MVSPKLQYSNAMPLQGSTVILQLWDIRVLELELNTVAILLAE
jgi:hypothetical protein